MDNKGTHVKDSSVRLGRASLNMVCWICKPGTSRASSPGDAEIAIWSVLHQNTPYGGFLPSLRTGSLHTSLPSVNVATVKTRFLPLGIDERGLKIFGPLHDLMSERPSYQGYTVQDTIDRVLRNLLSRFQTIILDFEVRSLPYKEAKMRLGLTD